MDNELIILKKAGESFIITPNPEKYGKKKKTTKKQSDLDY